MERISVKEEPMEIKVEPGSNSEVKKEVLEMETEIGELQRIIRELRCERNNNNNKEGVTGVDKTNSIQDKSNTEHTEVAERLLETCNYSDQSYPCIESELEFNANISTNISEEIRVRLSNHKPGKRSWDKVKYCLFCRKPYTNISKHLLTQHVEEEEVDEIHSLPINHHKRKVLLEYLKNRGNYIHNRQVLKKGKGEIIPCRCPPSYVHYSEFAPCDDCFGFFQKKDLWKHRKECLHKERNLETDSKNVVLDFLQDEKLDEETSLDISQMKSNSKKENFPNQHKRRRKVKMTEIPENDLICDGEALLEDSSMSEESREVSRRIDEPSDFVEAELIPNNETSNESLPSPKELRKMVKKKMEESNVPEDDLISTDEGWKEDPLELKGFREPAKMDEVNDQNNSSHVNNEISLNVGKSKPEDNPAYQLFPPDDILFKVTIDISDKTSEGINVRLSNNKPGKRSYDKVKYCLFCKKPYTNISKHLLKQHIDDEQIQEIQSLPINHHKRKLLLEYLKNRGNYLHNCQVLKEGRGEIIPCRCPPSYVHYSEFAPCDDCFGFYQKKDLWKHRKECLHKERNLETDSENLVLHFLYGEKLDETSPDMSRMERKNKTENFPNHRKRRKAEITKIPEDDLIHDEEALLEDSSMSEESREVSKRIEEPSDVVETELILNNETSDESLPSLKELREAVKIKLEEPNIPPEDDLIPTDKGWGEDSSMSEESREVLKRIEEPSDVVETELILNNETSNESLPSLKELREMVQIKIEEPDVPEEDFIPKNDGWGEDPSEQKRFREPTKMDEVNQSNFSRVNNEISLNVGKSKPEDNPAYQLFPPDDILFKVTIDISDKTSEGINVRLSNNKPGKRSWDKVKYCLFCKKPYTNISKHLLTQHKKEPKIEEIRSLPISHRRRKLLLEYLKNRGNYLHNCQVLKEGRGEIIPCRCPPSYVHYSEFAPCDDCFGFYQKKDLWKHRKECLHKERNLETDSENLVLHFLYGEKLDETSPDMSRMERKNKTENFPNHRKRRKVEITKIPEDNIIHDEEAFLEDSSMNEESRKVSKRIEEPSDVVETELILNNETSDESLPSLKELREVVKIKLEEPNIPEEDLMPTDKGWGEDPSR